MKKIAVESLRQWVHDTRMGEAMAEMVNMLNMVMEEMPYGI